MIGGRTFCVVNMLSSAESALWQNELLKALENDPNLSNDTKKVFKSIKHKSNTWKTEIEQLWQSIDYPALTESDVIRLNAVTRKDVESKNKIRANQRNYYLSIGDELAASQIPDIEDPSMSAKECIVKAEQQVQGWIPQDRRYQTIVYNKKPDLDYLKELIEKCAHSNAINLPKTIINILQHGVKSGYAETHYASVFLQLIREQMPEAFIAAQTYSTDTSQLFSYLLNLIDTTAEIEKCRVALKNIIRKSEENISIVILKVKAITTSLYFLVSPHATLESITRKSNKAAIEAIYSLISDATKAAQTKWKRRANELDKDTSLAEHLECVASLEQDDGYKITRDMKLPSRFGESDVTCFFSKFNMRRPSLPRSRRTTPTMTGGSGSDGEGVGRAKPPGPPGSKPPSRPPSRPQSGSRGGASKSDRIKDHNGGERGRSLTRKKSSKGEYQNRVSTDKCRKCMGRHSSQSCVRYPFYYNTPCNLCKNNGLELFHPPSLCRFTKSRYVTPSPEKSPISYRRNKASDDGATAKPSSYFY